MAVLTKIGPTNVKPNANSVTETFLTSNSTAVYWASSSLPNTSGQNVWSNTQTFANNVVINSGLSANGSFGSNGQVLTSNGTVAYWGNVSTGATFSNSATAPASPKLGDEWYDTASDVLYKYVSDGVSSFWLDIGSTVSSFANVTIAGSLSANGSVGTPGQVLTSSGSGVYWSSGADANNIIFNSSNTSTISSNTVQAAIAELDAEKVAKAGDTMTGALTLSGDPTVDLHAATKQYVDNKVSNTTFNANNITYAPTGNIVGNTVTAAITELDTEKVAKAGDTMTGFLTLSADPTANLHATTKQYVDVKISNTTISANNISYTPAGNITANNVTSAITELDTEKVAKAGDTMTGFLTLSAEPTVDLHAATKKYVDDKVTAGSGARNLDDLLDVNAAAPLLDQTLVYDTAVSKYVLGYRVKNTGDTMTGFLTLSADPTLALHAATKQYVDTSITNLVNSSPAALDTLVELANALGNDANFSTTVTNNIAAKVNKAGDVMTGALTLPGAPSANLHAATKEYVDTKTYALSGLTDTANVATASNGQVLAYSNTAGKWVPFTLPPGTTDTYITSGSMDGDGNLTLARNDGNTVSISMSSDFVLVAGDTMTGRLTLSGNPTANLHAATKQYVDTKSYPINSLSDVDTATSPASNGQVLSWDGTNWVPASLPPGTTDTYTANASIDANGVVTFTRNDSNTFTVDISTAAVLVGGDTMTGLLTLSGAPTANLHAATKEYVDTKTYTLAGLTDVDTTGVDNGFTLSYSNTLNKWVTTRPANTTPTFDNTSNNTIAYFESKSIKSANGFTYSGNTLFADAGKAFTSYQVITKTSAANGVSLSSSTLSWDYSYHKRTITAATTFTFGAPTIGALANNDAWSMTIELAMNGGSVTWPASIKWPGGTAPTLTNAKTHLIMLVTSDGGTTVYGSSIRDY